MEKKSFMILKRCLMPEDMHKIYNHIKHGASFRDFYTDGDTPWEIYDQGDVIYGKAVDNTFDMEKYLDKIGIDSEDISWGI